MSPIVNLSLVVDDESGEAARKLRDRRFVRIAKCLTKGSGGAAVHLWYLRHCFDTDGTGAGSPKAGEKRRPAPVGRITRDSAALQGAPETLFCLVVEHLRSPFFEARALGSRAPGDTSSTAAPAFGDAGLRAGLRARGAPRGRVRPAAPAPRAAPRGPRPAPQPRRAAPGPPQRQPIRGGESCLRNASGTRR